MNKERRVGALILGAVGIASFLVLATGLYSVGIVIDANQIDPDSALIGPIILTVMSFTVGVVGLIVWIAVPRHRVDQVRSMPAAEGTEARAK